MLLLSLVDKVWMAVQDKKIQCKSRLALYEMYHEESNTKIVHNFITGTHSVKLVESNIK